jgi:predicted ArsR family transcriptional regulator
MKPYPHGMPGFKTSGPSQEAAEKMNGRALTLRDRVLDLLSQGYALTADEIAQVLGVGILSIRPRVSELHKQNLIRRSSERRKNASGLNATVWLAVQVNRRAS